jgi:hypothetical protein
MVTTVLGRARRPWPEPETPWQCAGSNLVQFPPRQPIPDDVA